MDILSHIILANTISSGVLTTAGAILPDLTMIKRKTKPDKYYVFMHSPFSALFTFAINPALGVGHLSHIVLDFFTHGGDFSPQIFFPISKWRCKYFKEWEFFNSSFWFGISIVLLVILNKII